ncbi:hypothetical protein BABINDRAFT_163848 [Babjeviella inositovora NRRL Y-12698]|uniref:TOG domain-containing protein n=1 Tax=Babjeviella inositovora NRRL Y-12698 TaxID=984486 RepID=A0A1E3QHL2_9ASCO|nr:uncharacterized protein BABINDRAFT_163848 [Babjeviella inositovora NRRL Y-12698]ODQ77120.1 hypothetical protein BABINDRAFT_163848 [Babjeviella inositovora NRRL Y-12698]
MSALPADINAMLMTLMAGLSSVDNTTRAAAEKSLTSEWTKKARVEMLLIFLAEQAAQGETEAARAFAAVLFRRIAIKSPEETTSVTDRNLGYTSDAVKAQLRATLLAGFSAPQTNGIRHKLADAISELAKEDLPASESWPELLPALFAATQGADASFRESAFRILAAAPELIDSSFVELVLPVFTAGFDDANDDVRIAACTAFVAFFQNLPKKAWPALSPLLPNLLNSLPKFLQSGEENALASVLESLIELVELAPKMFQPLFSSIIEFCGMVSKNKELDAAARMAALELLTTFSETSPKMCQKEPSYTASMVVQCLSLMTEVCIDDDEAADWAAADDADDDDEPEYDAARQALDRVALRLGGACLAGPLFQYLPQMLQSAEWRERQAALMALSAAAEGCCDVLITEIPKILDMILPSLNDAHPRVQYACCNALGQISTDFSDVIQKTAGDRIIPALVSKLTGASIPRVQAHAAAALVNFSENASKDVLEPYLDDLLTNLLQLLLSPHKYVQEQVLTTIAIIADAAEKKFVKYYDTLMPLLFNVLKTDTDKEHSLLKAKCIECSTLIATAVGKEKFAPHCAELIQIFAHIQEQTVDEDDAVKPYLEQGWGRVCRIIGADFLPYLPGVLPPLFIAAKATQDISLLEEDEAEELGQNEAWDVIQLSGKHIAVHTAVLDDKASAMDLLRTYAEVLKGDFYPYVQEIATEIVMPAFDFYLHDGVRHSAAMCIPALLRCAIAATGAKTSPEVLALWALAVDKLFDALANEPVTELIISYYTAIVVSVDTLGPNCLSSTQLDAFVKAVEVNMTDIHQRISARDAGDDEYTENVDDEEEEYTDEEILDELNRAIGSVFKACKGAFVPGFQKLVPIVAAYINDSNAAIKLAGICIISDLLENTGTDSYHFKDLFLNAVGEGLASSDAAIRQSCAFSVGAAAQHGGEQYAQFVLAALEPLFAIITGQGARSDENVNATDNAVSAVAKIARTYGASIPNLDAVLAQWVKALPVLHDTEAAQFAYVFLSELITSGHACVADVAQTVDVVIQALVHAAIAGKTAEAVVGATKQLLGTVPQAEAMAMLGRYPVEAQTVIQKWFA